MPALYRTSPLRTPHQIKLSTYGNRHLKWCTISLLTIIYCLARLRCYTNADLTNATDFKQEHLTPPRQQINKVLWVTTFE